MKTTINAWWLSPWSLVCHAPADAGGGSASASDPAGDGADSTSAEGTSGTDDGNGDDDPDAGGTADNATDGAGGQGAVDPDDELDALTGEDDAMRSRSTEERLAAVLAKNKRLARDVRKLRPLKQQVGDRDIHAITQRAEAFDRLQEMAETDPERLAEILGLQRVIGAPSKTAKPDASRSKTNVDPELIDIESLPFDRNGGDVEKFLGGLVDRFNAQARELSDLKRGVQTGQQRQSAREISERNQKWDATTKSMAEQIKDPGVRTMFTDIMTVARDRDGHRLTAEKVAAHYLKQLNITGKEAQRATDAARSRVAKNTTQLPRQAAGGSPAGAGDGRKKTFASIRERIAERFN